MFLSFFPFITLLQNTSTCGREVRKPHRELGEWSLASGDIGSGTCQKHAEVGKKMETVTDFIFLAFRITVDSDCSHEIKRCLLFGRKAVINLDSILKSRDITLLTYSQSYGFSSSHVQM